MSPGSDGAAEPSASSVDGVPARSASPFARLYRGETAIDFVGRRRWWFLGSGLVILAGLISLAVRRLNFGIDFVGGTAWQVPAPRLSVSAARAALRPLGLGGATIEALGSGRSRTLEVQDRLAGVSGSRLATLKAEVTARLAHLAGVSVHAVSLTSVGPTWGSTITDRALIALVVFFVAIAAYIALRFEWKMAVAALVAVVHDLLVTVGVYSLSGLQVTPSTVVAVLTILGYSLYDTIVVFDRVQENAKGILAKGGMTYSDAVNLSENQTLMRSLNTSIVAILPILSVLVIGAELLGATTLKEFGFALFIGLTSGAYSSLFIASPLLAILKEREPRYRLLRERLAGRSQGPLLLTPAAAAAARAGSLGRAPLGGSGRLGPIRPGSAGGRSPAPAPGPLEVAPPGAGGVAVADEAGPGPDAVADDPRPPLGRTAGTVRRPPTSKRAQPRNRKRRR